MAVPKRKTSKARTRRRKAHWKVAPPTLVGCPRCHQPKLPHRVCENCGYYGEREVIKVKEA